MPTTRPTKSPHRRKRPDVFLLSYVLLAASFLAVELAAPKPTNADVAIGASP